MPDVTGWSNANRRRHVRSRVLARCWIERESITLFGRVVDLGEGGLFLRTAVVLPPGTDVRVHLRPAGVDESIRAQGTVAWVGFLNDGDVPMRGIGICFDRIEEGEQQLLDLLTAHAP